MKNIFTLSLIALALMGCKPSSSTSDTSDTVESNESTEGYTGTAVDGYLVNAEVYVDRNGDSVADEDEYVGLTDENGNFEIDGDDSSYEVIIKAVAGKTSDTDVVGYLIKGYELTAEAGAQVISPFTTTAKLNEMDVESYVASIGLDPEYASGDYINSEHDSSKQAHVFARMMSSLALSSSLSETIADTDFSEKFESIRSEVDEMINNGSTYEGILSGASSDSLETNNSSIQQAIEEASVGESAFMFLHLSSYDMLTGGVARFYLDKLSDGYALALQKGLTFDLKEVDPAIDVTISYPANNRFVITNADDSVERFDCEVLFNISDSTYFSRCNGEYGLFVVPERTTNANLTEVLADWFDNTDKVTEFYGVHNIGDDDSPEYEIFTFYFTTNYSKLLLENYFGEGEILDFTDSAFVYNGVYVSLQPLFAQRYLNNEYAFYLVGGEGTEESSTHRPFFMYTSLELAEATKRLMSEN